MNIGAINYNLGASYGAYSQKLTQETKNKLEEYGIFFNKNISEEEGKKLIQQFEASKSQNNSFSQNNSNESDLLRRAKELAKRLGIVVNEEMDFKKLLALIELTLKTRIEANKNNPDELKKLENLSRDLASIQAMSNGSSGYDNTNQALMASLELLSQYNKNFLNN